MRAQIARADQFDDFLIRLLFSGAKSPPVNNVDTVDLFHFWLELNYHLLTGGDLACLRARGNAAA